MSGGRERAAYMRRWRRWRKMGRRVYRLDTVADSKVSEQLVPIRESTAELDRCFPWLASVNRDTWAKGGFHATVPICQFNRERLAEQQRKRGF